MVIYKTGYFDCIKNQTRNQGNNQGASIDEINIMNFIKDRYMSEEKKIKLIDALTGQHKIVHDQKPLNKEWDGSSFYLPDGFTPDVLEFDHETKQFVRIFDEQSSCEGNPEKLSSKGTIIEVLGDWYHSNLYLFPPAIRSDKIVKDKYFTHRFLNHQDL